MIKKIAIVSSMPFFIHAHIKEHIKYLLNKGYHITLITKRDDIIKKYEGITNLNIININFQRKISILNDFICFIHLIFIFSIYRFNIIHSYTPKVGFLVCLSSYLTFNDNRIHTFTGQHWKNYIGISRKFYKLLDRIVIKLNTNCYADSYSQIKYLINEKVCKINDLNVIHKGSIGGINLKNYNKKLFDPNKIKSKLNISKNFKIITFVGRVNIDKGIFNLLQAISNLNQNKLKYYLLVIGPMDILDKLEINKFNNYINNNIKFIKYFGYKDDVREFLSISDLFCLPSLREGFGTSVIEAGAMEVSVLVSNIYGLNEIINTNNGFLLEKISPKQIEKKINEIFQNNKIKKELSNQLYKDIKLKYNCIDVCKKLEKEYTKHIE